MEIKLSDHDLALEIRNFFNQNLQNKRIWCDTEAGREIKMFVFALGYWKNRKRGKNIREIPLDNKNSNSVQNNPIAIQVGEVYLKTKKYQAAAKKILADMPPVLEDENDSGGF